MAGAMAGVARWLGAGLGEDGAARCGDGCVGGCDAAGFEGAAADVRGVVCPLPALSAAPQSASTATAYTALFIRVPSKPDLSVTVEVALQSIEACRVAKSTLFSQDVTVCHRGLTPVTRPPRAGGVRPPLQSPTDAAVRLPVQKLPP